MTVVCLAFIITTGKSSRAGFAKRNDGARVVAAFGRLPGNANGHDTPASPAC
jgi:hypothetical protein